MKWFRLVGKYNERDIVVSWRRMDKKGKELFINLRIGDDKWDGRVKFEEKVKDLEIVKIEGVVEEEDE